MRKRIRMVAAVALVLLAGHTVWKTYRVLEDGAGQVYAAWSLVDGVYQARAEAVLDFLQQLEAAGHSGWPMIDEVAAQHEAVTQRALSMDELGDAARVAAYQATQRQLGHAVSRLLRELDHDTRRRNMAEVEQLEMQLGSFNYRIRVVVSWYNGSVRRYNGAVHAMPVRLFASPMGHAPYPMLSQ